MSFQRLLPSLLLFFSLTIFLPFTIKAMEIFVYMPDGRTISFDMEANDTIENLKSAIHNKEGIPIDQQSLFFNGTKLLEGSTLADYNIQKTNTLQLVINTLAVSLRKFNCKVFNRFIELTWTTSSESQNKQFIISRSTDGIVFNEIGTKEGAGTSIQEKNYTFRDSPAAGTNYYRLSQVDMNGTTTVLGVCSAGFNLLKSEELSVYPNPIADIIYISLPSFKGNALKVKLVDVSGKQLVKRDLTKQSDGNWILKLEAKPKKGVYLLHLSGSGLEKTFKLLSD